MSPDNRKALASRMAQYVEKVNLDNCLVVFHGGEPLLAGVERILETVKWIREALPEKVKVDFSIQTNGVLVNEPILDQFEKEDVAISLSLDGPRKSQDLHRLTHKGNSSYDKVMKAYEVLKNRPSIFTGVIAVLDVRNSPRELLEFFSQLNPPSLDILLPDANYISQPPFRKDNPEIYKDWLIEAFDVWFDQFPHLPFRTFEALITSCIGGTSETDAFGFGDVSLLNIETDGMYHDLDVLKITEEGKSALGGSVKDTPISDLVFSPKIKEHRNLLSYEGVSETCKNCEHVNICGGGSVPHRYSFEGFENPTVYCKELYNLISHIQNRLIEKNIPLAQQIKRVAI